MKPSGQRILLIDFLRGVCLVLMTVDHLPQGVLWKLTWHSFGFVSAAEGFMFLSGFVTGNVYGRTALSQGIGAATGRTFRRLRTLYLAHVIACTLSILAASAGYVHFAKDVVPSWHLWQQSIVLFHGPSFLDILRLYCVFFLFVPLIFWALVKGHFKPVLVTSFLLWLLAWLGFGMSAIPKSGYFDLVSWQLLFVVGVCLGFRGLAGADTKFSTRAYKLTTLVAVLGVATLFVIRHGRLFSGHELPSYWLWLLTWRRTLPVVRLLNFAALAFVIFRFRQLFQPILLSVPGKAVAYLGKHSLQVFIWSAAVSLITQSDQIRGKWLGATTPEQMFWASVALASCFIPAWLHSQWRQLQGGLRAVNPTPSPVAIPTTNI